MISHNNGMQKKLYVFKKGYLYGSNNNVTVIEISRICNFINQIINRHNLAALPIDINLAGPFQDKLSYVLLECIIYYMIVNNSCKLTLQCNGKFNIFTEGLHHSCLGYYNNKEEFENHFENDISVNHYRKVVKRDSKETEISTRVQDIESFLKNLGINSEYVAKVSNVIGELIDNAIEHGDSDCIVDIDVTNDYMKNTPEGQGKSYYGLNIVVVNFSNNKFGESLGKKLKCKDLLPQYDKVLAAKIIHQQSFDARYTESDFNAVASFQHRISGRENTATGGTGLTQLIKVLEEQSDYADCYVLYCDKVLVFKKDCMERDKDEWVGFNRVNSFMTAVPDEDCVGCSGFYMPGMAYNLNFVIEKEIKDEKSGAEIS